MPVRIISTRERVTAFIEGELDHHTAADIREEIDAAVRQSEPNLLKLDFADVTFMDSSGVGLIMGRYRIMQSFGGRVIVTNLSPQIYRIMKLAGLEKIAKISKREDANNADNK